MKTHQKHTYKLSNGTDMEEYRENPVWDLSKKTLTNNDFVLIASLMPKINLTTLNLSRCGITDISALNNSMPNVTELNLSWNKIVDIGPLNRSMPNVTDLNLCGNQIQDISALNRSMPNVTELDLHNNQNVEILPLNLTPMPNVRHLNLSNIKLSHNDIVIIALILRRTHITKLLLNYCGITNLRPLRKSLRNITHLEFVGSLIYLKADPRCQYDPLWADVSPLYGAMPNLSYIDISRNKVKKVDEWKIYSSNNKALWSGRCIF